MTTRDNHPLYAAINAKLAEITAASSEVPAWHEAWSRLAPESTKEQRLEVSGPFALPVPCLPRPGSSWWRG